MIITQPGVYDLTAAEYFADPVPCGSLSSTGARKLLPPSCPALFAYAREHPPTPKREFDIGHAAHLLVLGKGAGLAVIPYATYRSKAAQEAQAAAHAAGKIPVLKHEHEQVLAMAAALWTNTQAAKLFVSGQPEQVLVWIDEATGVWCRAMLDWLNGEEIVDYKTSVSASPSVLPRKVAEYGYHQQEAFYLAGVRALGLAVEPQFTFVFQEKTPPYLVTVRGLDDDALAIGAARNRLALEIYRDCTDAGVWPGYGDDIEVLSLPPWARRGYDEIREQL